MSARRRSSQYSLFPNCSSPPSESNHTNVKIPSRQSSVSSRSSHRSRNSTDLPLREIPAAANEQSDNTIIINSIDDKRMSIQRDNMSRVISLKLEASSVTTQSHKIPPSSPVYLWRSSSITSFIPEEEPISPKTKRPRPGPVTDLTIFPYTLDEWKKVMEEVKILYSKGQYKHCSMRCKQIINHIKDPHQTHPLYSVYLSFFAASSLEMTASTLHNHSSSKLPLFQESLSFYQRAQSDLDNISYHQRSHSTSSSISSSIDSIFSSPATSARSSLVNSPIDDTSYPQNPHHKRTISASSSFSSLSSSSGSVKRKKKVSFSMDLSFSDSEPEQASLLDSFPSPPSRPEPTITSTIDLQLQSQQQDVFSGYLFSQSVARYKSHLRGLSLQLEYHISSIHSQIRQLSLARKTRRSNTPTQFTFRDEEHGFGMEGVDREEVQKVELRERIRRLKENSWRRERFDGERYRVLCERALIEACER